MLHLLLTFLGTRFDQHPFRERRHFRHRFRRAQQRVVLFQVHHGDRHLGDHVRRRRSPPQGPHRMHAQRRSRAQQLLQRRFDQRLAFLTRQVQQLHVVPVGPLRMP
jgi:hypothetical protein